MSDNVNSGSSFQSSGTENVRTFFGLKLYFKTLDFEILKVSKNYAA